MIMTGQLTRTIFRTTMNSNSWTSTGNLKTIEAAPHSIFSPSCKAQMLLYEQEYDSLIQCVVFSPPRPAAISFLLGPSLFSSLIVFIIASPFIHFICYIYIYLFIRYYHWFILLAKCDHTCSLAAIKHVSRISVEFRVSTCCIRGFFCYLISFVVYKVQASLSSMQQKLQYRKAG